ncbi:Werner syndrome ATP-dependent helicase [Mizuhopecten yessoensis]|uniref:Werner syndrome ATP-dependent helicase n=1 Tax=Mizuhopecten yessoensis TaxID=6573 RepID=A0A210QYR5_MIZYE|nr:Werner syndrome ATP-dependent helicase [Mizuhopecten yessoensis]
MPMIVIIVTPLNSIMIDQVQSLCKRGIPACFIDASSQGGTYSEDDFEDDEVAVATSVKLEEIREGKFCLVYAHPETLVDNKEVGKLLPSPVFRRSVCCTVVDKVHMISEWGEDFRKAFNKLG